VLGPPQKHSQLRMTGRMRATVRGLLHSKAACEQCSACLSRTSSTAWGWAPGIGTDGLRGKPDVGLDVVPCGGRPAAGATVVARVGAVHQHLRTLSTMSAIWIAQLISLECRTPSGSGLKFCTQAARQGQLPVCNASWRHHSHSCGGDPRPPPACRRMMTFAHSVSELW